MDSEIGWGKPRDSEIRGNRGGAAAAAMLWVALLGGAAAATHVGRSKPVWEAL